MAIRQINTADFDYEMMLESINKSYKGKADITIDEYDTDAAPDVKTGSVFDANGAIFIVESSDITPTGYAGVANDTTFYYIGNPPKMFGFAWDDGSKVTELKTVIQEKEWIPMRVEMVIKDLRTAYEKYQDDSKFSTVVENKKITVVDSSNFVDNLKEILSHIEK